MNCGKKIPDESAFCTQCGQKVIVPTKFSKRMLVLAGCAAALSMIFALLSFFRDSEFLSSPQSTSSSAAPKASPSPPLIVVETPQTNNPSPTPSSPAPLRQTIVNDALSLLPGRYRSYRFVIDSNYRNPRVTGYVAVQTGGRRDIYMIVVNDQSYQDFSNGLNFTPSHRLKVFDYRKINITNLKAGIYHLILSNTHSRFTGKRLEARLAIETD